MSTLKPQHAVNPEITEEAIADYLQANPEFFERHSMLLNSLRLPHSAGGAAVSLVERQILVLRQKNLKLERKLKDLVDIARGNDTLAARIHSLAMLMLAAPDQSGVIRVLEEQLRVSFNADRAILVVFDAPADAAAAGRFLRVVGRDDPQVAPFRTFLQSNAPRCGQIRDAQRLGRTGAARGEFRNGLPGDRQPRRRTLSPRHEH